MNKTVVTHSSPCRKTVLSLYTGAGGLDLGLEAAGFDPVLCVEINRDARQTVRLNRGDWRFAEPSDIHEIRPADLLKQACVEPGDLSLLSAGPPCQPFSKSGYWSSGDALRLDDPRAQTIAAYLAVVEEALPRALILENVKGIAFSGKSEALLFIQNGLEAINRRCGTSYAPQVMSLNAADYGVPQNRERIFVVASIDGSEFDLPSPTHGAASDTTPYLTAWDAIGHLDSKTWPNDLDLRGRWADLLPSIPEGQNYLWHTPRNDASGAEPLFGWRTRYWSFLLKLSKERPSWTIQAAPGPATGPFHWRNRQLSIEELCRLQTFPEKYEILGDRRSAHRQIGNAVPSAIGELFGLEIRRQLFGERVRRQLRLIPNRRTDRPGPEPVSIVQEDYLVYRDKHLDHPGTGLGPSALNRRTA